MNKLTATAVLALLILSGCDSAPRATTGPDPTREQRNQAARERQTVWWVLDEDGNKTTNLADDQPDVTAVRKVVALHSNTVDNRDHRTITEHADDEYGYYHPAFAEELRAKNYTGQLVSLYTTHQLRTHQTNLAWYTSTFPRDLTTAKVDIDVEFQFDEATAAYLAANQLALATPYVQHRTISLAKTGDRWTITKIDKSPLTRRPTTPG
ncbi:hypothetical protein [Longispora urticae]